MHPTSARLCIREASIWLYMAEEKFFEHFLSYRTWCVNVFVGQALVEGIYIRVFCKIKQLWVVLCSISLECCVYWHLKIFTVFIREVHILIQTSNKTNITYVAVRFAISGLNCIYAGARLLGFLFSKIQHFFFSLFISQWKFPSLLFLLTLFSMN